MGVGVSVGGDVLVGEGRSVLVAAIVGDGVWVASTIFVGGTVAVLVGDGVGVASMIFVGGTVAVLVGDGVGVGVELGNARVPQQHRLHRNSRPETTMEIRGTVRPAMLTGFLRVSMAHLCTSRGLVLTS